MILLLMQVEGKKFALIVYCSVWPIVLLYILMLIELCKTMGDTIMNALYLAKKMNKNQYDVAKRR